MPEYTVIVKKANVISLDNYQDLAIETAMYPDKGENILYPACGLAGEAGEFLDKIKKMWRNRGTYNPNTMLSKEKLEVAKELGDVLWYAAAAAKELGFNLSDIASMNIDKLRDRRDRGVIKSEGDNR